MNRSKLDASSTEPPAGLDARWRGPLMSYFLRRVRSRAEAEDLTQEVFLRVLGRDEAAIDNAEVYVFQVAANLLRDRVRRRGARRADQHVSLDESAPEWGAAADALVDDRGPERVLLGQQSLAEVMRALDELGERPRDIFILYRLEKMKHREIADLYGLSVSSVEKYVIRAVAHLADRFGRAGEGAP